MNFYATKRFKTSIDNLLSKKNKYGCVLEHLYTSFHNKNDQILFEEGFRLNGNHPVARMLKLRMKSCGSNGKSEGFRIIVFVNKKDNRYYFLDIYPKTGPLAKSNMKKDERKDCLTELKVEKEENKLLEIKFNDEHKIVTFV